MKKSLVLSIVMCLVLVASMTTATFAWYSANDSVIANINTITAASATGDLQIKFGGQASYGYEVSMDMTGTLNPISPKTAYGVDGVDTSSEFLTSNWYTGKKTPTNTSLTIASPTGNVITGTIELYNASNAATNNIALSVTPSFVTALGELSDLKYVFANGSTIYASNAYSTVAGEYANKQHANQETLKGTPAVARSNTLGTIAGNTGLTVTYYIWLDGFETTNTSMGAVFNMNLRFAAAESYVLTYDGNTEETINGVVPSPATGTNNTVTVSNQVLSILYDPAVPATNGKQLIGWSTTAAGEVDRAFGSSVTLTSNTTIYAVWKEVFTLVYNGNGTDVLNVPSNQVVFTDAADKSSAISSSVPTRNGYTFKGWATSEELANAGTVAHAAGAEFTLSANTVLYAVWQAA